jgi:hypothetical protein
MGLKDIFRRQLRTVIEWKEQKTNLLFHQLETTTDEIKDASKLIIAPGQGCIIVYDGQVRATLTEPGVYEMESDNHPFITTLLNISQQAESDHKMRFYFFRTAEMVNILWGTPSPVKYFEPEYKLPITLGACGNFSIVISDPEKMFVTLLGPISDYYSHDIQQLVSSRIMTPLTTFLAEKAYTYREVDTHLMEMSEDLKNKTAEELERLGLTLTDFRINSVTFDEDTRERIGRIANMTTEKQAAAEVDLDYVSMQKLEALRDAARNEGGLAGAGLQMGAGLQLAQDIFKTQGKENSREGEITDRLRKLKILFNEQLITEEEYEKKKNEILSKL